MKRRSGSMKRSPCRKAGSTSTGWPSPDGAARRGASATRRGIGVTAEMASTQSRWTGGLGGLSAAYQGSVMAGDSRRAGAAGQAALGYRVVTPEAAASRVLTRPSRRGAPQGEVSGLVLTLRSPRQRASRRALADQRLGYQPERIGIAADGQVGAGDFDRLAAGGVAETALPGHDSVVAREDRRRRHG